MATNGTSPDALLCLRQAIASNNHPILTTSSAPAVIDNTTTDLAQATHLQFHHPNEPQVIFALNETTRFVSPDKAVDLRAVYFAWQRKEDAITDYIAATRKLNEDLPAGAGGSVQNLVFAERLDLINWLEGSSEDSEYIKPLDEEVAKAHKEAENAASIAAGGAGGASVTTNTGLAGSTDKRLQEIYNSERRMGDRNSILHGIKPTVGRPTPVLGSGCS